MIIMKFLQNLKRVKKELHPDQMNGSLTILFLRIKVEQIVTQIVRLFLENIIEKNGIIRRMYDKHNI